MAALLLTTLAGPTTAGQGPAAAETWSPLVETGGSALAVSLDDRTTALVSVGGPDTATIYDQRLTAGEPAGPAVAVMTVAGAESCRPVEAVTALGNLAVAVECQTRTDLEDPPTRLAELVWTGDDGWVWRVHAEGELGSVDYSPRGQFVVFTSNSRYGRAHRVTSYHADLGWRDLRRRELASTGDEMVAAISDTGNVVALRGAGFEDEPGYWFGGRLVVETYSAAARTWTRRLDRRYPDGGIHPAGVDAAGGRIVASVVESRSTGRLHGLADRVVLLSGKAGAPRTWSAPRWTRRVLTSTAAVTGAGVGVFAWQSVPGRRTAKASFATWAPQRGEPRVHDLRWPTTLTAAAEAGLAMDLSVSANGHSAIAYVRHRRGADHASVAGVAFRVTRNGALRDQVDVTWREPVAVTVSAIASATSSSITLGRLTSAFVLSPLVRYSVGP